MALTLLSIVLLGFIPYLVLVWRAPDLNWSRVRATILTFAVLLRLGLLFLPATLSTDTAQYLWEGKLQIHGFNPYKHAPSAVEVSQLRDANWELLPHPDAPSRLPPGLLLLSALVAWLAPFAWTFKFLFFVCDLLTFRMLVYVLRGRKQNAALALIWAFNPLVMLEFAGNGHSASLAILLFVTGLWLFQQRLTPLGAFAFGLSALTSLFAWPAAIATLGAMRIRSVRIWLWFLLPIAFGYAVFINAGQNLLAGLLHFSGHDQFNGSVHNLLASLLDPTPWRSWHGIPVQNLHTKVVSVILLFGLCIWLWRRRVEPVRVALIVTGSCLLLSPTVPPWATAWLVALACLEFSLAWLMFSAVVLLAYVARVAELQTGLRADTAWVRWIEYIPLFILLGVEIWRRRFDSIATRK